MTQPVEVATEVTVNGQPMTTWLAEQMQHTDTDTRIRPTRTKRTRSRHSKHSKHASKTPQATAYKTVSKRASTRSGKRSALHAAVQTVSRATKKMLDTTMHLARVPRDPPENMKTFDGPVTQDTLGESPVFTMVSDEWRAFQRAAYNRSGEATFTGRAVNTYIGHGEPIDSESHDDRVAGLVGLLQAQEQFEGATQDIVMVIDSDDLAPLMAIKNISERERELDKLKERYLTYHLHHEGLYDQLTPGQIRAELGHVWIVSDYHDPEAMLLVWHPPRVDGEDHRARPRVSITELFVDEEGVAGVITQASRHGAEQVTLDPNLALKVFKGVEDELYYDADLHAYRTHVPVDVVDQADVIEP